MSTQNRRTSPKPLRLWPGVVAVAAARGARFGLPVVVPGFTGFSLGMMWRSSASLAVVLVWWLFFSRAPLVRAPGRARADGRRGVRDARVVHASIASGIDGTMLLVVYAVPVLGLALVAWAVASRRLSDRPRRATMVGGDRARVRRVDADADRRHQRRRRSDLHWRWTPTPEERLLAQADDEPAPLAPRRQRRRLPGDRADRPRA